MDLLYKHLYYCLFNRISSAIEAIDEKQPERAKAILISAQQETEEEYITYNGN